MDNTTRALTHLVKLLRVPVTSASIKKELENHPDYPSLLAISDVLTSWGVDNIGHRIKNDLSDLTELPSPFIAHIQSGKFVTVKKVNDDHLIYINKYDKEDRLNLSDVKSTLTGTVLLVTPTPQAGEKSYAKNKFNELINLIRLPFLITGVLLTLFMLTLSSSYLEAFSWQTGLLTFFLLTGLVTSVFLLIETIDINNPFVRKFCTGKNVNCQAVLSSKGAKILWGELSWSEVGYFYFAGSLLLILLGANSLAMLQTLAVINVLALPYTFYSIYYQKFKAKKWCLLCCTVQAILWVNFFLLLPSITQPYNAPSGKEWLSLFLYFFIPALAWFFIKPYLVKSIQVKAPISQLKKFKNNFKLFKQVITGQVQYALLTEQQTIMMGNPQAINTVTIITNPFCNYCNEVTEMFEQWVAQNDNFKLQLVFAVHREVEEVTAVARHLLDLKANKDPQLVFNALTAWHRQQTKDYSSWAAAYPTQHTPETDALLERQADWCKMLDLHYTPTVMINGYKLPEQYNIEDIKYFLFNNHLN